MKIVPTSGKWTSDQDPFAQMFLNILSRKYQLMSPEKIVERGRWGTYISLYKQSFQKNNFVQTSRVWARLKGLAKQINFYKRTLCL